MPRARDRAYVGNLPVSNLQATLPVRVFILIAAAMLWTAQTSVASEPLVDLGGVHPDDLDPGIHCIDRTGRAVRRIVESPATIVDPLSVPASGRVEGDIDIDAEQRTTVGERQKPEPSGLVWNLMKPMRDLQEDMREKHGQAREARDRSWGFSSTTRIKGHVHAGGHLSLGSPRLRGLPECRLQRPQSPELELDVNPPAIPGSQAFPRP